MKKVILLISILTMLSTGLYAEEEKPASKGMGLTVEPGGMLAQNIPVGTTYDFTKKVGIPLTIYNRDDKPHTYILSTNKPSEVAAKKWLSGYLEIPNPDWFRFDKDEVSIEPNSAARVNMYLKIPDAEKYYNQHWALSLGVSGKAEAGQMFALAAFPRIEIETLSKEDVNEKPSGVLATVPSTLVFEDISLGKRQKLTLRIFNNDEIEHKYKITSMIFPHDPKKRQIYPSKKYSWIPNKRWITLNKKRISIKPYQEKELTVGIRIPKKQKHYNKNWEAILFIEPKKGLPAFARVQIHTKKAEENEE